MDIFDLLYEIAVLEDELSFRTDQWLDARQLLLEKAQGRNLNGTFGEGSGGEKTPQQIEITPIEQAADLQKLTADEKKAYKDFGKNRSKLNTGLYKLSKMSTSEKKFVNEQTKLLDRVTAKVRRLNTPSDTLRVVKTPDSDNFNDMGVNDTFNDSSFLTGAPDGSDVKTVVNDKMPMGGADFHVTVPEGTAMVKREDNSVFGRRGLTYKILENKMEEDHRILRAEVLRSSLTTYVAPKKSFYLKKEDMEGYDVWPEYVVALENLVKVEQDSEETDAKMLSYNKCIDKLSYFESRIKQIRAEILEKRQAFNSFIGGIS